jgi:PKD repeat protein
MNPFFSKPMKKLILFTLSFLAISFQSKAQCDAQFTHTFIDCDSVWFVPVSSGPQYTYYWNFGDGTSSTSDTPVHVFAANGTYSVILVLSDTVAGCTDVLTVPLTVNCGVPCTLSSLWTHSFNTTNCEAQFVSTVMSGSPPYTYFWDFGDGTTSNQATPTHQFTNNSSNLVCYTVTDNNGCDTTICDTIISNCSPTACDAQFTYSYASCDSIWFAPVSQGAQYVYNWDFGDGNFSNAMYPSHQYASDGTYPVVLQLLDTVSGCNDVLTIPVTVNCGTSCSVNGAFAYTVDSITCDVNFVSTAFGGTAPYTFYWDFGDGYTSTAPHPVHQFQTTNWFSYTCLTITDVNGCDTVLCDSIVPNCTPASCDAMFTAVHVDCDSIWFYPVSSGLQYSYYWDFGDGNTSNHQSPTHVYGVDGVYVVTLTVIDSLAMCTDMQNYTILIDCGSSCTVDGHFTSAVDTNTCEVQFVSSAWGGSAPYSYYWTFGDGGTSTLANPSHLYPTNGTWTPCLTITDANGCDTSFCLATYVNCNPPACNSDFTYTYVSCDSVWFVPNNAYSGTALYTWYFGDGSTSNSYSDAHQYTSNGTYAVILEVWDSLTGCYDSTYMPVTVNCSTNCSVSGAFTWYADSINCDIQFISTAFGGTAPYTFYWDFGDGTTSTNPHPVHNYPNYTTFTPCLTITDANGCDTTICDVVYSTCTGSSCDAQFTQTYITCDSVWFVPVSMGSQYDYYWDFGDGSSSTYQSPAHQYAANGTYLVVLYLTDSLAGCYQAFTMAVTINCGFSPCGVNGAFASVPDSTGCTTYFTSTAYGGTAPYSYYWQFGDGTTSSQAHPSHQYPSSGSYTDCLTITDANGCDTTICDVNFVNCAPPPCDASFTHSYIACDSIWFIPVNQGSQTTYFWEFGDGATSNAMYPAHQYATNGTYTVILTLIDSLNMCSSSYTQLVTVNCNNNCSIGAVITYVQDSTDCSVLFASSTYGGSQPYSYFWDFGDSTFSNLEHPNHTYSGPGPWFPCFTVTDANGCDTTICMTVYLNCTPNGIQSEMKKDILVYPNPSNGLFNIELPAEADLYIYDVSGKLITARTAVSAQDAYALDLTSYESGAYILRIKIGDELISKRLIIQ